MKRALFLLTIALVLSACGSDSQLEDFTEQFNKVADNEGVSKLIPEQFGEMEELDDESWRVLYESDRYHIDANYENDNFKWYSIVIDSDDPYKQKEGKGYQASVVMAQTLGLSAGDYSNNFDKALNTDIHSYAEGDYEVTFVNIGHDSTIPTSLIIRFEEK